MALSLTDQASNIKTKLRRLQTQVDVVLGSEFPNKDARAGALELETRVKKQISRFDHFDSYSPVVRSQLLKDCNYNLAFVTELLGFIIRSTTSRNLFELYHPFIRLARSLVDKDVKLILSSDWQFSPFTYPYGLDELPKYILIGLPASESENVLVFPAAGHELGHNIWRAHKLRDAFNGRTEDNVYRVFEANRDRLGETFPSARTANIRGDMIAQPIARSCLTHTLRQMEELFCDLVALRIFGASYLFAFDYILSPTITGSRTGDYPSTKTRARLLTKYGAQLGIEISQYEARFAAEPMPDTKQAAFLIEMADVALEALSDDLFSVSGRMIDEKIGVSVEASRVDCAKSCFRAGVPCAHNCTLGDLINAAWSVYNDEHALAALKGKGVSSIPLLTDLVVKSSEISEFKEY